MLKIEGLEVATGGGLAGDVAVTIGAAGRLVGPERRTETRQMTKKITEKARIPINPMTIVALTQSGISWTIFGGS
jgi:hypothetical protein